LRGSQRGIQRQAPARWRADQPGRTVCDLTENRHQVIEVGERFPAGRGLPVTPPVIGHHGELWCEAASHFPPAAPVGHTFVQQHDNRGVPRPALSRKVTAVDRHGE